jgi:branched-chain amino acid transport system substrate-binding protein
MKRSTRLSTLAVATVAALVSASLPASADTVKIGYITTFTGESSVNAKDVYDAWRLALTHLGGKLGGMETQVITGDDQEKPDTGRQLADQMIERDKVDIITGIQLSNVLLAVAKPVTEAGVLLISTNAGPSQLAGAGCSQNFFSASWQNDNDAEPMGMYLTEQGVKSVYLMGLDYAAGHDKMAGFKRYYKGQVLAEIYTPYTQLDYSAEIAQLRAAKPEALFYFYGGASGIAFPKQLDQAGVKSQVKVYADMSGMDQSVLPAVGDAALGIQSAVFWSEFFDNEQNKRFVEDFEATYHRIPSIYAAQGYDTANLIDSAIRKVGGNMKDKAGLRKALEAADFKSVRGSFKFNQNHFPIQDWYLATAVKDEQGRVVMKPSITIVKDLHDAYASQCKLPPAN